MKRFSPTCTPFLLVTIWVASSCAPDELDQAQEERQAQLQLEYLAGVDDVHTTELLLDVPVDKERQQWLSGEGADNVRARPDTDAGPGRYKLVFDKEDAPAFLITADLETSSFNVVKVIGYARRYRSMKLDLLSGKKVIYRSPAARFLPLGVLQEVTFTIPDLEKKTPKITGARIRMSTGSSTTSLFGIQFLKRPTLARIEGTPRSPELIRLGSEARRGTGISSQHPLLATLPEGFAGEVAFSFGLPDWIRPQALPSHLRVQVLRAGVVDQELAFEFDSDKEAVRWREEQVQLKTAAGPTTQLRFDLVGTSEGEAICAIGVPELIEPVEEPATVLLITSDTHRADYLGASRSGVDVKTPFLDALAAKGVIFTDCGSVTNVTNPSHISILTGTSVRDTGIVDNATPVAEQAETLAEAFKKRGYITYASVSAGQLRQGRSGLGQGFDRMAYPWKTHKPLDGSVTLDRAAKWLEAAQGRPLFLWVHLFDAHTPYESPEDYYRDYYPSDKDPYDSALPELEANQVPSWDYKVRDLEYIESRYRGEVTYLDQLLGKFLSKERFQQAVIGFTADHGEWMLGPQHWFVHATLSPSTLNVPLIISWPGAPAGERVGTPVQNVDLGRTLLDLAGETGGTFPGKTLFPEEAPEAGAPRFTIEMGGKGAGIRSGKWFLVINLTRQEASIKGPTRHKHAYHLYDFKADPVCQHDLRAENAEQANKLRATLIGWLQAGSDDHWAVEREVDQKEIDQLAQLGYSDALVGAGQGDWFEAGCACEWCQQAE